MLRESVIWLVQDRKMLLPNRNLVSEINFLKKQDGANRLVFVYYSGGGSNFIQRASTTFNAKSVGDSIIPIKRPVKFNFSNWYFVVKRQRHEIFWSGRTFVKQTWI